MLACMQDNTRCRCHIFVSPKGNDITRGIKKASGCSRADKQVATIQADSSSAATNAYTTMPPTTTTMTTTTTTTTTLAATSKPKKPTKLTKERRHLVTMHLFLKQLGYEEEGLVRMVGLSLYEWSGRKILINMCETIPLNAVLRVSNAGEDHVNGYYKLDHDGDGMITWPKYARAMPCHALCCAVYTCTHLIAHLMHIRTRAHTRCCLSVA